jgi:hypothetical protein
MLLWEISMIRKSTSLVMAIAMTYLYFQSLIHYDDPLFLIVSNNIVVNIGLLMLVGAMVWVSFLEKFRHWQTYAAAAVLALILGLGGLVGILSTSLDYYFSNALLPLDYLAFLEISAGLGICVLSYKHQPVPRQYLNRRLMLARLRQRAAQLVPKPLVQPPQDRRPRAA